MIKAGVAGAIGSVMQPVAEPTKNFWEQKAQQAETGIVLGYGFSVAGKALSKGTAALLPFLSKRYPEEIQSEAVRKVLGRIEQGQKAGGPSAQQMLDLIDAASVGGKPMTLADVGGKPVRNLAGSVYRSGGEAAAIPQKLFEDRDNAASRRLSQDVHDYVSGGPTSFEATEGLLRARSAASTPAYEEADRLQRIWSSRLQQFLKDDALKSGMRQGYELERLTSLAERRPFDPTMLGIDLDAAGEVKFIRTPNLRVLDMGKRGLDAMIAAERNEITGRLSARGVALDKVRRAYIEEIDSMDKKGIYKKARDAWAGPSASLDALRVGQTAFNNSPEENAATVAKLSTNDREFALIGLADKMKERFAKAGFGADEAKAIVKNEWTRGQIRPFFRSEEDFNRFAEAVTRESQMFNAMRSISGGSQTAERVAEDVRNDRMLAGAKLIKSGVTGHWLEAAHNFYRLHKDLGLMQDKEVNKAIAKILFSPSSPENRAAQSILFKPPEPGVSPVSKAIQDVAAPIGAAAAPGAVVRYDDQGRPIPQ